MHTLTYFDAFRYDSECLATSGCSAINVDDRGNCALRACKLGTPPTWNLSGFTARSLYNTTCNANPPSRPPTQPQPPPIVYGFRFATTHSDHMVLQAAPQRARVWGFAFQNTTSLRVCIRESNATINDVCVMAVVSPGPSGTVQVFTATFPARPPTAIALSLIHI